MRAESEAIEHVPNASVVLWNVDCCIRQLPSWSVKSKAPGRH